MATDDDVETRTHVTKHAQRFMQTVQPVSTTQQVSYINK